MGQPVHLQMVLKVLKSQIYKLEVNSAEKFCTDGFSGKFCLGQR